MLTGGLTIRGLLLGKRDTDAKIAADRSADQQRAREKHMVGHVEEGMRCITIGKRLLGEGERKRETRGERRKVGRIGRIGRMSGYPTNRSTAG